MRASRTMSTDRANSLHLLGRRLHRSTTSSTSEIRGNRPGPQRGPTSPVRLDCNAATGTDGPHPGDGDVTRSPRPREHYRRIHPRRGPVTVSQRDDDPGITNLADGPTPWCSGGRRAGNTQSAVSVRVDTGDPPVPPVPTAFSGLVRMTSDSRRSGGSPVVGAARGRPRDLTERIGFDAASSSHLFRIMRTRRGLTRIGFKGLGRLRLYGPCGPKEARGNPSIAMPATAGTTHDSERTRLVTAVTGQYPRRVGRLPATTWTEAPEAGIQVR